MAQALTKLFKDSKIRTLIARSQQLAELDRYVRQHLPPELAPHCQIGNYREQTLILITDSANWATRLRYLAPDLLGALRQYPEFTALKRIECRVQQQTAAHLSTTDPAQAGAQPLSQESAKTLEAAAEHMGDSALKESLLRLSRRQAPKNR